jgi:hypothetical protein
MLVRAHTSGDAVHDDADFVRSHSGEEGMNMGTSLV